MSASATSSYRFSSATPSVRLAIELSATCIGKAKINTWDFDPRHTVVLDTLPSLMGYYLHKAHLACARLSYIILRTSKPVSRLIKASCNPLSADEILSITVFISTRCSSEMAARPINSLRTSDRTPDGAGLFCPLSSRAGHWELRGSMGLSSVLTGFGEALCNDTSGSPASGAEESGGGILLSIISRRRSPKDELI